MEPSAGVPGPTGNNQHFQMPLNSWLSEAEELLVPPQHHRLCKQRLCLFLCQGFWMSLELQCPAALWERGCPGGQKLRTVIQVMSRIMVQVFRDHPTNSESSAPAQGVNQEIWDGQEHSQPSQPSLKAFKCEQGCNFQSWSSQIFL